MLSYCSQLKTEYEHLKTLKQEFVLEFEKAKASGLRSRAWKLLDQLEAAKDALKEKLERFITEAKALAEIEKLLAIGANKGWVALDLAGLNSAQAWELRERLLKEGANKGWVARGLAGLDSKAAWDLRERLLKEGADKDYVARGLAGDYITFVWQLRRKNKSGLSSGNIHK